MAGGSGTEQTRGSLGKRERTGTFRLPRRRPPTAASSVRVSVAARTDVGRVRRNNEDTFQYDGAGIYLVCDGMGGMAAGEVASQIAAETTLREFLRLGNTEAKATVKERLGEALAAANREVLAAAREPGRSGMGTTLVAAAVSEAKPIEDGGEQLLIANVGDSRAYLVHDGVCRQITRDHSYANEVQRISGMQPEEIPAADMLRFGSLITRAIGAAAVVEPDFFAVPFAPGDVVLLASDGLTRYFSEPEELLPLINAADLEGSCEALIAAANAAGGIDNITVLLLSRVSFDSTRDERLPY